MIRIYGGEPASNTERKVFSLLERRNGVLYTNFHPPVSKRGRKTPEVDSLLITPEGCWVVEAKGLTKRGVVATPVNGYWTVGGDEKGFSNEGPCNPGSQANKQAQEVKSSLLNAGLEQRGVYINAYVVLDGPGNTLAGETVGSVHYNDLVYVVMVDDLADIRFEGGRPIDAEKAQRLLTLLKAPKVPTVEDLLAEGFQPAVQKQAHAPAPSRLSRTANDTPRKKVGQSFNSGSRSLWQPLPKVAGLPVPAAAPEPEAPADAAVLSDTDRFVVEHRKDPLALARDLIGNLPFVAQQLGSHIPRLTWTDGDKQLAALRERSKGLPEVPLPTEHTRVIGSSASVYWTPDERVFRATINQPDRDQYEYARRSQSVYERLPNLLRSVPKPGEPAIPVHTWVVWARRLREERAGWVQVEQVSKPALYEFGMLLGRNPLPKHRAMLKAAKTRAAQNVAQAEAVLPLLNEAIRVADRRLASLDRSAKAKAHVEAQGGHLVDRYRSVAGPVGKAYVADINSFAVFVLPLLSLMAFVYRAWHIDNGEDGSLGELIWSGGVMTVVCMGVFVAAMFLKWVVSTAFTTLDLLVFTAIPHLYVWPKFTAFITDDLAGFGDLLWVFISTCGALIGYVVVAGIVDWAWMSARAPKRSAADAEEAAAA